MMLHTTTIPKAHFIGLAWSEKLEEQIPTLVDKVEERFRAEITPEYLSLDPSTVATGWEYIYIF